MNLSGLQNQISKRGACGVPEDSSYSSFPMQQVFNLQSTMLMTPPLSFLLTPSPLTQCKSKPGSGLRFLRFQVFHDHESDRRGKFISLSQWERVGMRAYCRIDLNLIFLSLNATCRPR